MRKFSKKASVCPKEHSIFQLALYFFLFLLNSHTYREKESEFVQEENRNSNSEHSTERKVNYRTKDGRNVKNVSK